MEDEDVERGTHHREMWVSVEGKKAANQVDAFYTPTLSALNAFGGDRNSLV